MEKKEKIYIGIIVILVLVLGIVIGFLIKGNQNKFYGIVAMDFGGDANYRMIFETNFNRLGINN